MLGNDDPEAPPEKRAKIPLRDLIEDDERLQLAAKIAFAGVFTVVLTLLLTVAFIAPVFVTHYVIDPLVLVPITTAFIGAILMLLGIRTRFWKGDDE